MLSSLLWSFMLLLMPGYPGEHYLTRGRVLYGVIPIVLSLSLMSVAGWFWSRTGGPASLSTYIQRAFLAALGAVVVFWVGLIVVAHLQGRIP